MGKVLGYSRVSPDIMVLQ